MACLHNPRPIIGFLRSYTRLKNANRPMFLRNYSDFWDDERRSYQEKWRHSKLWDPSKFWDRRTWNMTSNQCIFWRRNPSDLEAHIVIVASMLAGVSLWAYLLKYREWAPRPPEYDEDLEDITDDPLEIADFALPGALKAPQSHYCKLLYKNDIRVLVLHPGQFDDEIQFHMEHIRLRTSHPKYEALSYSWGNQAATEIIRCSDKEIPVTSNVYSALQHLRYQDRSRCIWVDALCIDQGDIDERNQQVRLMGDVFSEAERVVVWLGEKDPNTASAMLSLKALYADSWFHSWGSNMLNYILWSKDSANGVLERSIPNSNYGEATKTKNKDLDWVSIGNLLRRSWFHRLWVIQEVSHAKRAVVVCGDTKISWTVLSGALAYVVDHDLASKHLDRHCVHACNNVINMEKIRHRKTRDSLFNVVLANTYGGCADPRDKIFAMMSISEGRDVFDWEISFDYSLSVTELFKRFAIWDIIRYRSLRSLSCATTGSTDFRVPPPLPSWVPDWTRLLEQNLLVRCKATSKFSAALQTESDVWFTHNNTRMHIRGAVVDHIRMIGSAPHFIKTTSIFVVDKDVTSELASMNAWLLECWNIAKDGQPMTRTIYEAFWKTMLCGLTSRGYPAPRAYSGYFSQYWKYLREAPAALEYYLDHPDPVAPYRLSTFGKILVQLGFSKSSYEEFNTDSHSWSLHQWFNEHIRTNSLIEESLQMWGARKRFCRTEDGRLARVPKNAAVGDSICILHGSEVPYVLRLQEDGSFTVIGECYVHGMMHGEALKVPSYLPETLRLQ